MRKDKTFQNATLTHEIRQRLPQSWDPVDVFPDTSDTMNSFWRDLAKPTQNFLMHVVGDIINRLIDDDYLQQPATDEWVECSFEDIQKGDRVKLVCKVGQLGLSPSIVEVEPDVVSPEYITWARGNNLGVIERSDVQAVYRIPKPVQHPDPEVHAVIIVSGAYDVEWDHAYAYVSDGTGYNIVEPINSDSRLLPEAIHNWSPAKVVEDDR